ncbi:pyridoxal phosphate-dependent aminotransferase [Rariglobus hedericola]|uniref:Aminotransferase n=1 Tax=Rariglobus hedericola TaxID=2597822 RepID=A0A556QRE3_9BACT|nr:aminotransferase class I/II-fold pyridoxal phosphate-dependent enzyme [Rariglobus hedericola]TSJ79210.1 aminotransferase class I/II-fold pyridoxal phosphate-dependent enzyme [Rariglobus hedericola]
MPRTSRRTSVFTESLIREMSRVAAQHGAINLSQGFPDGDPPAALVQAAKDAMDAGRHQYAITWGSPELRDALAAKLTRFTGLPVDPLRELVVTCGATEAMLAAVMTVCDPGDRIGMFSPFYENYNADAILSGATAVHVPLHPPQYGFDPAELRAAFATGGGLKAFILCNPSNPCGRVFTREELLQIAALAEEFDTFVITDEVYEHLVFDGRQHVYFATLPGMAKRTLSVSSLSKTFSITGWRLGYLHAAPEIIAQARKVHDFLTVGAAAPLQHAVVTALGWGADYYAGLAAEYQSQRDVLLGYLDRTGLTYTRPEGAYFVMLDISPFGYASDVEFAHWMAKEIGVAPVPGSSFFANGENRYVRLNFAKKPATLHAAGERLLKLKRG